jgi:protein-S-isoprenylcysteine O-methyltransferase Ste14
MPQLLLFLAAWLALLWVSWPSLRHWRSHGFPRFFAWEAIVALVLLNLDDWFHEPFSPHQIVSWFLLAVSLILVLSGVRSLSALGQPSAARTDPSLVGIEKTTRLVTAGAFRYIRHPLYSSLLFLTWGAFCKAPSWAGAALAVTATALLVLTARVEEAEDCRFFGPAYHEYMTHTRMFIPFVW